MPRTSNVRKKALKDAISLLKGGSSRNLVIEALVKDYNYSISNATNIVREAQIHSGIEV